jgi:hypothetical protein
VLEQASKQRLFFRRGCCGSIPALPAPREVTMRQGLRKFSLTIHIAMAVGWIGAVSAYLVVVVAALTRDDLLTLRTAWIAMDLIGWYLIVPLALASLVTGLVMSLGTPWGLLRHYWVVVSLVLTTIATTVLLIHMPTVSALARAASEPDVVVIGALREGLRSELLHAGVGLLVLFVIEVLNVYKPQGMTAYGRHRVRQAAVVNGSAADAEARFTWGSIARTPRWVQVVGFHVIGVAALLLIIIHLTGGSLRLH